MVEDEFLYGKKHVPKLQKAYDDISGEVNAKIRTRGIAKGMVCVQESMNREVLASEKMLYDATTEPDAKKRLELIGELLGVLNYIWVDLRYMLKNRALTPGEIGFLSKDAAEIKKQLKSWEQSIKTAMQATAQTGRNTVQNRI